MQADGCGVLTWTHTYPLSSPGPQSLASTESKNLALSHSAATGMFTPILQMRRVRPRLVRELVKVRQKVISREGGEGKAPGILPANLPTAHHTVSHHSTPPP